MGAFLRYCALPAMALVLVHAALAQPGSIDIAFNASSLTGSVSAIVVRPDGRIVVGGSFVTTSFPSLRNVARLWSDGSFDRGFDTGSGPNGDVSAMALQADGKVVIGGPFTRVNGVARRGIARLNANGSLDASFNPGGALDGVATAILIRPDGRVLVSGLVSTNGNPTHRCLVQISAGGVIDETFIVRIDPVNGDLGGIEAMQLMSDGRLYVTGPFNGINNYRSYGLTRLLTNGAIDSATFLGPDYPAHCLALQPDGKLIVGGSFTTGSSSPGITRLEPNGSPDYDFIAYLDQRIANPEVRSVALQNDGKVLIAGVNLDVGMGNSQTLIRFQPNGELDTTFISAVSGTIRTLVVANNGNILVGLQDATPPLVQLNSERALLIRRGSPWKYFDGGSKPDGWRGSMFDDRNWRTGQAQLGYGDGDENTTLKSVQTAYFRRAFQVPDVSVISALTLDLLRDDGAVVYLNGTEVLRSNMPNGPVGYDTAALQPVRVPAEAAFLSQRLAATYLRNGTNVLAIEVHQADPSGSDLSFDLELRAEPAAFVSITSPTNGQRFASSADVPIEISTNRFAENLHEVQFFIDGVLVGTDREAPYSFAWRAPPVSEHSISAVAIALSGFSVTSAPVRISAFVHPRPYVSLLGFSDGNVFLVGTNILLSAVAVATDASLTTVEFLATGVTLAEVPATTNGVYEFLWTNVPGGVYSLMVIATDSLGGKGFSPLVGIRVSGPPTNQPPAVSVSQPHPGATVRGPGNITLEAAASDTDGYITRVTFVGDGVPLAEVTGQPYRTLWQGVSLGVHQVVAIATDNEGATNVSAPVTFTVADIPLPPPRGPYLQKASPTSVTVNWRTEMPTDSLVRYSTDAALLDLSAEDDSLVVDHSVTLGDLEPDTKYFYAVGNRQTVPVGQQDQFVVTPPPPGTAKDTRIWVIGDSGTAGSAARAVRDAYYNFNGSRYTDLWLMLGDNAYGSGMDNEYQRAVFDMYPELLRQTVVWSTMGNHDVAPAYLEIFTLPTQGEAGGLASGTESYYSFDYGNIHFICLNAFREDRSPQGPMLTWLRNDLEQTDSEWIIAFWHHPPYSRGSHNSDFEVELVQMRENAVPILEQYGADLVLGGHSHCYERSFLLQGHYGLSSTLTPDMLVDVGDGRLDGNGPYRPTSFSPRRGTVYVVAGSSGQVSGGSLNHPAMFVSWNQLGSLVLDIHDGRLDAKFLEASGEITDHFTIEKHPPTPPPPPPLPPVVRIRRNENQFFIISWTNALPGLVLEATSTLDTDAEWTPVDEPVLTFGSLDYVRLYFTQERRFFRLKKPQ